MAKKKYKFDYDDDCRRVNINIEYKCTPNSNNIGGDDKGNHFPKGLVISCVMIAFILNPEGVIEILQLMKDAFEALSSIA